MQKRFYILDVCFKGSPHERIFMFQTGQKSIRPTIPILNPLQNWLVRIGGIFLIKNPGRYKCGITLDLSEILTCQINRSTFSCEK